MSLEDGSNSANSHLNNSCIDALAVQSCQDAELKAHALCSFGSDVSEESLPTAAVTHQVHACEQTQLECSACNSQYVGLPCSPYVLNVREALHVLHVCSDDMQECRSHAINVHSEECSTSSAVLRADEMIVSWTDRLIIQTKPVGKGTFGTVYM